MTTRETRSASPYSAEKFPWKAVRTFAASRITKGFGRSTCVQIDGPDYLVTTYHRTEDAARRTASSTTRTGYVGILKAGRVERNEA